MITERRIILQFSTFLRVRAITNGITKCVQPLRSEFFGSYLVRNIQNMRAREGAQLQFDIGRCVIIIALTYPFPRRTTTKEKNYSSLARSGSSTRFRNFRNPCLEPCIPSNCFIVTVYLDQREEESFDFSTRRDHFFRSNGRGGAGTPAIITT